MTTLTDDELVDGGALQPDEPILSLHTLRHSAAHLMAAAVVELYPGAQYDVGPPIDDGFFYNFSLPGGETLKQDDLSGIEARMLDLASRAVPFSRESLPRQEAVELFRAMGQKYKVAIIEGLPSHVAHVGIYRTGDFVDLCRGPHVPDTSYLKVLRLLRVAGVYWRGDETREQLQRVYGTAWFTIDDLLGYQRRLEEAERRDHRRLGQQLELFHLDPTAPGMPYWLPHGLRILNGLLAYWREVHEREGYQEIASPLINDKSLWEKSGHWDHYRDNMFVIPMDQNTTYGVKPMNCPNAMVVYNLKRRSYRDLPLRLSDCDTLHRRERSGTFHGLLRVQKMQQDDAHHFVTEDQIEEEYRQILRLADQFYSIFQMEYRLRLGTRPEAGFLGDIATWDRAEATLKRILANHSGPDGYEVAEGDGAFYGPKIDILMHDAIGRDWQMGTIQLDFQLPQRFECIYIDAAGCERTPVVIHRVIYGSLERFIGILIEHCEGRFPLWLSPVQCGIVTVQDDAPEVAAHAHQIAQQFRASGLRVDILDRPGERMQAKIRQAELQRIPYVVVVGRRDVERADGTVVLRSLRTKQQSQQLLRFVIDQMVAEVDRRDYE